MKIKQFQQFQWLQEKETDPTKIHELSLLKDSIADVLSSIPPREARAIELYFGLNGEKPHTYKELGAILNVSTERTRQIVAKGIRRLQHPRRKKALTNC